MAVQISPWPPEKLKGQPIGWPLPFPKLKRSQKMGCVPKSHGEKASRTNDPLAKQPRGTIE